VSQDCDALSVFERFTERARRVVVLAQEEARTLKHNYIGTEHILLGLVREQDGLASRALNGLDITVERVRLEVVRIVGTGEDFSPGQIPFTPRAKKVLELALREGLGLRQNYVGTEHILLGLVRENEGVAGRILLELGADSDKIHEEVVRMLADPDLRSVESESAPSIAPLVKHSVEVGFAEPVRELLMAAASRSLYDKRIEVELPDLLLALAENESAASALAKLLTDKSAERLD
jgi:ATP-dependent Clp protease ATP-binding subunit ClpA